MEPFQEGPSARVKSAEMSSSSAPDSMRGPAREGMERRREREIERMGVDWLMVAMLER